MSLKASFVSFLNQKYPQIKTETLDAIVSDRLISPFQITLSSQQMKALKQQVKEYWNLRNWGAQKLDYTQKDLLQPSNYSACMSYDFHINPEGNPELIEINTNASFLALGLEMYDFLKLPKTFSETELVDMFRQEGATDSIAIIDENPDQQRLYVEFLIYQAMFQKAGLRSDVVNFGNTQKLSGYSLIYNRYTDFYLESPEAQALRKLFNSGGVNFSPTPYEYFLMADKQRLLDWNLQIDLPKPKSLLKIYDLGNEDKDKIWSERKQLFFKPKNSYGGKQAYKGASMSRKVFDEVCQKGFVAQQLSVPAEVQFELDSQPIQFKYDLRCFAYKDQLQMVVARLYQGQATNLKTLGGGFAAVIIGH